MQGDVSNCPTRFQHCRDMPYFVVANFKLGAYILLCLPWLISASDQRTPSLSIVSHESRCLSLHRSTSLLSDLSLRGSRDLATHNQQVTAYNPPHSTLPISKFSGRLLRSERQSNPRSHAYTSMSPDELRFYTHLQKQLYPDVQF